MEHLLFYGMGALAVIFGLLVVFHANPIHSALALVGLLFNTAGLYAMLSGEFVAVIQILVYTGAIMVLFLFVIMLLNLQRDALELHRIGAVRLVGALVMLLLGLRVALLLRGSGATLFQTAAELSPGFGSVESVGELMFGKYLLPFEAISILLLAAIVGGLVMGKKKL